MRLDEVMFIEKGIQRKVREVDTFLAQRFIEKGMEFITRTSFGVDDLLKGLVEVEIWGRDNVYLLFPIMRDTNPGIEHNLRSTWYLVVTHDLPSHEHLPYLAPLADFVCAHHPSFSVPTIRVMGDVVATLAQRVSVFEIGPGINKPNFHMVQFLCSWMRHPEDVFTALSTLSNGEEALLRKAYYTILKGWTEEEHPTIVRDVEQNPFSVCFQVPRHDGSMMYAIIWGVDLHLHRECPTTSYLAVSLEFRLYPNENGRCLRVETWEKKVSPLVRHLNRLFDVVEFPGRRRKPVDIRVPIGANERGARICFDPVLSTQRSGEMELAILLLEYLANMTPRRSYQRARQLVQVIETLTS